MISLAQKFALLLLTILLLGCGDDPAAPLPATGVDPEPTVAARPAEANPSSAEPTTSREDPPAPVVRRPPPPPVPTEQPATSPNSKPAPAKPRKQKPKPKAKSQTQRRVESPKSATPTTPSAPDEPPSTTARPTVVQLPAQAERMCTGGAGRYLIFHFPQRAQLVVFDSNERVLRELAVTGDVRIAASREKLVVVSPGQNILQRYDLQTLKREKLVPLPAGKPVRLIAMGSAGDGPLALWSDGAIELLDLDSLRPLVLKGEMLGARQQYGFDLRVSADGKTFCGWVTDIGPMKFHVMHIAERAVLPGSSPDAFSFNGRWMQPTANGHLFLLFQSQLYGHDLTPMAVGTLDKSVLLPTEDPRFMLAIRGGRDKRSTVTICTTCDRRELFTTEPLEPLMDARSNTDWGNLHGEARVRYLPAYKLLITIPDENNRIVLRRLDLAEALAAAGPHLFVTSLPPARVAEGTMLKYELQTISSSADIKYNIEAGPRGMTVSGSGLISWRVRAPEEGSKVRAIVSARNDQGAEALHAFEMEFIPRGSPLLAAASTTGSGPAITDSADPLANAATQDPASGPVAVPPDNVPPAAMQGDFAQSDADRLELPDGDYQVLRHTPDRGYILAGKHLAVTDATGVKVEKILTLPGEYVDAGLRDDYLVAISNEAKQIDQIDLDSLKIVKHKKLPFRELTDLSLHPKLPVSYVAYNADAKLPRYRFLTYYELTNEAFEGDDQIGTWVEVAPGGEWLISGYRDIYQKGNELLNNPNRLHIVPKYGSLDWLIRYDLARDGEPSFAELKDGAGANGKGLRLSADGKRVSYLSHVGYPLYSQNLAAWDPLELKKLPVTYEVKDRGTTYDLAFHPVLPLVASPGSGSAAFFDRESGELQPQRAKHAPAWLNGAEIKRVYFSPDGYHAIVEATIGGLRYLVRIPLELSPAERSRIEKHNGFHS